MSFCLWNCALFLWLREHFKIGWFVTVVLWVLLGQENVIRVWVFLVLPHLWQRDVHFNMTEQFSIFQTRLNKFLSLTDASFASFLQPSRFLSLPIIFFHQETSFASNQPVTRSLSSVGGSSKQNFTSKLPIPTSSPSSASTIKTTNGVVENISSKQRANSVAKVGSNKTGLVNTNLRLV